MADAKKILVVDDHFEMLEFLRSMLELSNQDYEVLAVPSAEEGLFEIRNGQFDLLISDARLPGMSGFDLVRRVRGMKKSVPVIMITAYSTAQGQKEAAELGVYRYFGKPLDTDAVLSAVHTALYGEPINPPTNKPASDVKVTISEEVRKKLETLKADTGASGLMLATVSGHIVYRIGEERKKMDLSHLATIIARNVADSFLLAEQLGRSDNHFTIQYHAGDVLELYCASVGRHYFLAIFYDVQSRRGRIGTIWVFTQRAIKDLLGLLPAPEKVVPPVAVSQPHSQPGAVSKLVQPPIPSLPTAVKVEPPKPPAEKKVEPPSAVKETAKKEPVVVEKKEAKQETAVSTPPLDLNFALNEQDINLDAFWDDALSTNESEQKSSGLSFEEALKRGLFPGGLELDK